jgi:hypothetical protein
VTDKSKVLRNLLEFGIRLDLESDDENIFYALEFAKYIQESMLFDSLMTSETDIDIYNYEEKILTVVIKNGTLTLQPHAEEGAFEAVLLILKFVSEKHESIKENYIKLNTEDSLEEIEDESEDDSEWI